MGEQPFKGKVVWITGASAGMGREMALEFARRGADVAVSARRVDRLETLTGELEALGVQALAVPCDVTEDAQIVAAVAAVVGRFGRLDVAVANAGFAVAGRIENITAEEWRRQLDTNVIGLAMTARHALPELRKTGGRLALVGSVASMIVSPRQGPYSASKYAVRAIGQALSMELAGSGVSCTTLYPGFVESEIFRVDNSGVYDPTSSGAGPERLTWPTDKAARVMVDAIARRKRELVFTMHGKVGAFIGRHAPGLVHRVLSRAQAKHALGRAATSAE